MQGRIYGDRNRFRELVKKEIRKNLKKYLIEGGLIVRQGKRFIKIPIRKLDLPRFTYGRKDTGGVGQGEGREGLPVPGIQGEGVQGAGDQPGEHVYEAELDLEEFIDIIAEEIELPDLAPKGKEIIPSDKYKLKGLRLNGSKSLINKKKTFLNALKRQQSEGNYDPSDPHIIPRRGDYRYKDFKKETVFENNAVIFFMRDISASINQAQADLCRRIAFFYERLLRKQYKKIAVEYIVHDVRAKRVSEDDFKNLSTNGGTKVGAAYELSTKIIQEEYPFNEWNTYAVHFSDGECENFENFADDLKESLKVYTCFSYAQILSENGELINFFKELQEKFDNVRSYNIESEDEVLDTLNVFFDKKA